MKCIHGKMAFIHIKSFIYGHIHPRKWIKITLNFKFQAQSSSSSFTLRHKPSSINKYGSLNQKISIYENSLSSSTIVSFIPLCLAKNFFHVFENIFG